MDVAEELLAEIMSAIKKLDLTQVENMIETLLIARAERRKMIIVGAGRSGLVGRAFAMRLMHLGFNIFVMGETITPSIGEEDLVFIISGSGSTTLPVTIADIAKRIGAKVHAITSHIDSPLGKIADSILIIPGREATAREEEYHSRQLMGAHEPLAPMGTLFEDTSMLFLDSFINELMIRLKMSEEEMKQKHATIE